MFDVEKTSDLIQKSKDGDKDALDALIVENTPLVKSVVRRYPGKRGVRRPYATWQHGTSESH